MNEEFITEWYIKESEEKSVTNNENRSELWVS